MKLYVGNLSGSVTNEDLQNAFSQYGNVVSAVVIMDKFTRQSKGFGFVEFQSAPEAQKAMKELNATDLNGKTIVVNEARPKTDNRTGDNGGGNFRSAKRW